MDFVLRAFAAPGVHGRDHRSVLAAAEKRLLISIAERLPRRVGSDHLTALGAIGMLATAAAFAATRYSPLALALVPLGLAVNWFGDSLDGTVARVRQQQRPRYGFYVDHVIDLATSTSLFSGLALSGLMHPLVALGVLVAYLLLSAESFLATHTIGTFRLSFGGFGPTELRLLLAAGALRALVHPTASIGGVTFLLFDIGGVIAMVAMTVVFAISAVRNGRELYRAEPLTGSGV
jgi:phosphatidylglycerophosphate synthase